MTGSALIDLRNVYRPAELKGRGFQYTSIGR
jgi:UDPglucose 6-dehydrogenase